MSGMPQDVAFCLTSALFVLLFEQTLKVGYVYTKLINDFHSMFGFIPFDGYLKRAKLMESVSDSKNQQSNVNC
ncbi:hypothetical protein P343_00985 [Sporolactobacillus laevolacticus DSM 442]|uniref:Uncharacterized protein n=1 Tax=Sporolactobacillus laevolacticus DSM 442 TaxID=1395513 RepID=V6JA84_9BACL|nr:hypothetical protein P343_00985 [Sporolactobacillus laevolacticus DSM 442]